MVVIKTHIAKALPCRLTPVPDQPLRCSLSEFIVRASTGADARLIVGLTFGKVQPLNYNRANRFRQA
jgi:hypothetical protein